MAIDYGKYTAFIIEKKGKIGVVTLNKPETLNAIVRDVHLQLEDLLVDLSRDDEINVIVLTGAGKAFSAGGDIKWMQALAKEEPGTPEFPMRECYRLISNFLNVDKPIIGAINGHAIGLGATVALFCDVTFMAENAKIGDPHVNLGMVAGDGGAVIWPMLVGVHRAKQYLMTGDTMTGKEAAEMGLVNKALPQEEVLPAAMAFAAKLAALPTRAVNWTKMAINEVIKNRVNIALPVSLAAEYLAMKSPDHLEALNAYLEKRPPKFTGK